MTQEAGREEERDEEEAGKTPAVFREGLRMYWRHMYTALVKEALTVSYVLEPGTVQEEHALGNPGQE